MSISSTIMRTLQERNWIRVVGHREVPGHPELLGTTREFLDYFGLRSLDQLPTLAELRDVETIGVQLELPGGEAPAGARWKSRQRREVARRRCRRVGRCRAARTPTTAPRRRSSRRPTTTSRARSPTRLGSAEVAAPAISVAAIGPGAEPHPHAMSERLHKLLAQHGFGSRREIEKWMLEGRVVLNGQRRAARRSLCERRSGRDRRRDVTTSSQDQRRGSAGVSSTTRLKVSRSPSAGDDAESGKSVMESLPSVRGARWLVVNTMQAGDSGLMLLTSDGRLADALRRRAETIPAAYVARVLVPTPEFDVDYAAARRAVRRGDDRVRKHRARGRRGDESLVPRRVAPRTSTRRRACAVREPRLEGEPRDPGAVRRHRIAARPAARQASRAVGRIGSQRSTRSPNCELPRSQEKRARGAQAAQAAPRARPTERRLLAVEGLAADAATVRTEQIQVRRDDRARLPAACCGSSAGYACSRMFVRTLPGLMLFTRIAGWFSSSSASMCISPSLAHFDTR